MKALAAVLGALLGVWAFGEGPVVSNVQAVQRADGSFVVDIAYDVADGDSSVLWVGVAVSKNGGAWYGVTPSPASLEGDFGEHIAPGLGKHIAWHAERDLLKANAGDFKVRVTASDWPSAQGARSTFFGMYLCQREQSGMANFIDGERYHHLDGMNVPPLRSHTPVGPNGEPVFVGDKHTVDYWFTDGHWTQLADRQPDGATREWWAHQLRQFVDAGLDFVWYDTFGMGNAVAADCDSCQPNDAANNTFAPSYAGKAFGKILDEAGYPLKVSVMLDTPGAFGMYNWDRLREHYGVGNWCQYQWLDLVMGRNGQYEGRDPDKVMECMPMTSANVERYYYDLAIKPFFENYNRPQDRARWQTHNDLPLEQGGRPVVYIYAGGTQWFKDFSTTAQAFQHLKDIFERDFGVVPFLIVDNYWFTSVGLSGQALADLDAVADAKQSYIGGWIFGKRGLPGETPIDPNSWEFKNYRATRVSPGVNGEQGHWSGRFDSILGKRWMYVDGTTGADETYFLDREWDMGMGDTGFSHAPNLVIMGHWDDYQEGENLALISDYQAKDGGALVPDYFIKAASEKIAAFNAQNPAKKGVEASPAFALDTRLTIPGDLTGDRFVNALDIQTVINVALDILVLAEADVDCSGAVNALDIQLVINAALGHAIATPQCGK